MQPLYGLKLLDLTWHVAGPYCTKLLGDFGAEIIKVERPGTGDPARTYGPFPGDLPDSERSGTFLHLNTNKKSITVNLKTEAGKDIIRDLVRDADVVVESFSPGVLSRLELDYVS
jgi:crotonobetainyl-CoA:carnitine CoA-transferase CaiB-like acyl-CoA transferase